MRNYYYGNLVTLFNELLRADHGEVTVLALYWEKAHFFPQVLNIKGIIAAINSFGGVDSSNLSLLIRNVWKFALVSSALGILVFLPELADYALVCIVGGMPMEEYDFIEAVVSFKNQATSLITSIVASLIATGLTPHP